jgi:hypothetical protein
MFSINCQILHPTISVSPLDSQSTMQCSLVHRFHPFPGRKMILFSCAYALFRDQPTSFFYIDLIKSDQIKEKLNTLPFVKNTACIKYYKSFLSSKHFTRFFLGIDFMILFYSKNSYVQYIQFRLAQLTGLLTYLAGCLYKSF